MAFFKETARIEQLSTNPALFEMIPQRIRFQGFFSAWKLE